MNNSLVPHFIESFRNVKGRPSNFVVVLSKLENVSQLMANNWLTQESTGLNPDWFSDIKLFSIKYVNIVLQIISFKPLLQTGKREIGL